MGGWLYKLHHDREWFAKFARRARWLSGSYVVALGLVTGCIPALFANLVEWQGVLGLVFLGEDCNLWVWLVAGGVPVMTLWGLLGFLGQVNEAGQDRNELRATHSGTRQGRQRGR
jgi:hypothetical protein